MARFLLIHGSCHGAWCWRDVVPALQSLGHEARAIDLPSHGDDRTPVPEVTLEGYAAAILGAIAEPVVLVGHSMAGFPIALAAQTAPEKIEKLIFLCAYAPISGMSLVEMRQAGPRQPLLHAIRRAEDGTSFSIDPEAARGVFYHDCPDEAVAFAVPRLCAQAIRPQATPIALGAAYAGVPKHYVRCTDDRTIPPEYQQAMTADWPSGRVSALPCGHSPFFAMPDRLARHLSDIAAER